MLKEERCEIILKSLQANKKVLLSDLSKELHVSADTVRRDIKSLSALNLCKEVRGGAIPHAPGPHGFRERENFASRQKQLIAKKAIRFINNGNTIILDGGTSALAVANLLPKDQSLTVITNSFPICNILESRNDIEIFFAGGRLFKGSLITTGHDTLNFYKSIRADVCFLGVCSIDLSLGLTGHYYDESAVKKAMIAASNKVLALTTPEKLNTAEAFHICEIGLLDGIITSSPENVVMKPYKEAGIMII